MRPCGHEAPPLSSQALSVHGTAVSPAPQHARMRFALGSLGGSHLVSCLWQKASPAGSSRSSPGQLLADLLVEPDALETPVVVDRVFMEHMPLDARMPAGRRAVVHDDRAGHVLRQGLLDLPDNLLALGEVGFL